VESIAADSVLLIKFVGDGIMKCAGRQALMKGGVEYGYLRDAGKAGDGQFDQVRGRWIMQGCKLGAVADVLQCLRIDLAALCENFPAMNDPVANGHEGEIPLKGIENFSSGVEHGCVRDRAFTDAVGRVHVEYGPSRTKFLGESVGEPVVGSSFKYGEFERGTSRV